MQPKQVWLKDGKLQTYTNHWEEVNVGPGPTPPTPVVAVTGVTVEPSSYEIQYGGNFYVEATVSPEDATNKNVTWSSSDENVATVTQEGYVEGVGAGLATITATTEDGGFTDTCALEVTPIPVESVTISESEKSVILSSLDSMVSVTYLPLNADDITSVEVTSSNNSVATGNFMLDGNGEGRIEINSYTTGTCTLTVAIGEETQGTIDVTVLPTIYNFATSDGQNYVAMCPNPDDIQDNDGIAISIENDPNTGDPVVTVSAEGEFEDSRYTIDGENVFYTAFKDLDTEYVQLLFGEGLGTIKTNVYEAMEELYTNPSADNVTAVQNAISYWTEQIDPDTGNPLPFIDWSSTPVSSITLAENSKGVSEGNSAEVSLTFVPYYADDFSEVSVVSSDDTIATGVVTRTRVGEGVLTISGLVAGTCTLDVQIDGISQGTVAVTVNSR